MKKKKSTLDWILEWAGQKRGAYLWSVLLAIMNVIFKIIPYFLIGDVIRLFVNGEKDFSIYLHKVLLIALSFKILSFSLLRTLPLAYGMIQKVQN